ncbi:efflux RND transporter periplasmic adaptor subunit [Simiduia curdlanivorans]|uniref:Efflux RND transporter periplasmic adaptor subunit n=1 Tax=Simiduia curdlanivorans TaxID=1492769 RepID=A0ABV8V1F4_9GAMM|nr:efflux RND transporter periplasmic adaptor subunit [Simiduia curdlanivorans]MDN3637473.1 efflux RND transporter periplasmic adaptor subunit [Simiduia curdlanivorans]
MNKIKALLSAKRVIGLSLGLLALTISLMAYWLTSSAESTTLLVEKVTRGDIENYIGATGALEPKQYVEVGAQVSGQIKKIYIEEGDLVQAGQLLAEIDATVFETQVQNAEASLEGNRAQLQQLQAELELAELRAKRNKSLHEKRAVSEDTLFESQANEKILRAKIRAMEAQIKADTASLAGDRATLGYAKIFAPIAGTVVTISVREGQTLNANQNAPLLLKIADLSVLTLRADISEADVTRLEKTMPVYFKTFGGGERRWYSTVRQILPTPSIINDVVLYQALIDIDNTDGLLMDAMTTQVFFVLESAKDALLVPLGAVRGRGARGEVSVKKGAQITPVKVAVGVRNRTHAEIISGLDEGVDIVVGDRNSSARDKSSSMLGGGSRRP